MNAEVETRRFTVEEYEHLAETGFFRPDERVELLNGEIFNMAPIGIRHAKAVQRLIRQMSRKFAEVALVDSQTPFILDDESEPQPDILLLRLEFEKVMKRPRPADILLVVEVSDSTYRFDSSDKLRAYARNGIREYWIINLQDSCVEVYRSPQGERYTEQFKQTTGTMVSPLEFSDRSLAVADILA